MKTFNQLELSPQNVAIENYMTENNRDCKADDFLNFEQCTHILECRSYSLRYHVDGELFDFDKDIKALKKIVKMIDDSYPVYFPPSCEDKRIVDKLEKVIKIMKG